MNIEFDREITFDEWTLDNNTGYVSLKDETIKYGDIYVTCDIFINCTVYFESETPITPASYELKNINVDIYNLSILDEKGDNHDEKEIVSNLEKFIINLVKEWN